MRTQIELTNDVAAELAGPGDQIMKTLEEKLDADVYLRGNVLTLDGGDKEVETAQTVVREISDLVRAGHEIAPGTIDAITDALDHKESPSKILEDVVWRHRGKRVAPKTVNQKRYVDAIREHTVTVGIGPAGTGKSFLAGAMAVAALSRRGGQPTCRPPPAGREEQHLYTRPHRDLHSFPTRRSSDLSRTSSGATAVSGSRRRPSTRSATSTRSASTPSPSASGRRGPASRSSRSQWRSPRCRGGRSTGSCSPGR